METKDRLNNLEESVEQIKNHLGINIKPHTNQCDLIKEKKEYSVVGKWWCTKYGNIVFVERVDRPTGKVYGYGMIYSQWHDNEGGRTRIQSLDRKATSEEVEKMLIKEAEKRGIWDVPLEAHAGGQSLVRSSSDYAENYSIIDNKLWSHYGRVFNNGQWATPRKKKEETFTLNGGTEVILSKDGIFADGKEWHRSALEKLSLPPIHVPCKPKTDSVPIPVYTHSYKIGCEVVTVDQIKEILEIYNRLKG